MGPSVSVYFLVLVLIGLINGNQTMFGKEKYYYFDFVGIGTYDLVEPLEGEYN